MKAKLVQLEAVFWSRLEDLVLGKLEGGLANFPGCVQGGVVPGRTVVTEIGYGRCHSLEDES